MFAGSIYSVMVLAGWLLCQNNVNNNKSIVIKKSETNYINPIKTDTTASATMDKNADNNLFLIKILCKDTSLNTCAKMIGKYKIL